MKSAASWGMSVALGAGVMILAACESAPWSSEPAASAPVKKEPATRAAATTPAATTKPSGPRESFDEFVGRPTIAIDGDLADWPADTAAWADETHIFFRLSTPEPVTLQNSREEYALLIDLEPAARTGVRVDAPSGEAWADVAVRFSPVDGVKATGRGVAVEVARRGPGAAAGSSWAAIPHAAVGFVSAPTTEAAAFEMRLDRAALAEQGLSGAAGRPVECRAWWRLRDGKKRVAGQSDVMEVTLAPAAAGTGRERAASIPAKPEGLVRVINYNVLFAAPMKTPEPFARILNALDPDIVLVQEWEKASEAEIAGWFNSHVPLGAAGTWSCERSEAWGVAVVSRHPIAPFGPARIERPSTAPGDRNKSADVAVRFAGAMVSTPQGEIAAASIHLKCCGRGGSPEDLAREAEAAAINAAMREALGASPAAVRIIAGDVNLVGRPDPLAIMRRGLDADGTDLDIADAYVLGDSANYTWTDAASEFPPGRLDYFVFSDSTAEVVQTFVFDSAVLSDRALAAAGVQRGDSASSDHRPVVVDLRLK